jgi:uncharacterized protein GlcG (DUF336 family)
MSRITLKQANTIIEKALERARAMKIKPLAVVVLDDSGNVKAAQREDGASMFRFDVAQGKAWASVAMGASSRALLKRAKDNPNFFITLAATAKGKFLPQTGGVLIKNAQGEILGSGRERGDRGRRRGSLRARNPAGGLDCGCGGLIGRNQFGRSAITMTPILRFMSRVAVCLSVASGASRATHRRYPS